MNEFRYKDITLSSEERAKDLIHRMSIEEKVAQLQCYNPKDKNGPNLENSFHYGVGAIAFWLLHGMIRKKW